MPCLRLVLVASAIVALLGCEEDADAGPGVAQQACSLRVCDAGIVDSSKPQTPFDSAIGDAGDRDAGPLGRPRDILWQPDELSTRLDANATDPRPVPLDARSGPTFEETHVASARSLDTSLLRAEVDGVAGQVAPLDVLAEAFGRAGLSPDDAIAVYGQQSDLASARLVWTLAYAGHERVHLLDGGFDAWQASDLPAEAGAMDLPTSDYPDDRVNARVRVDTQWVQAHLDDPDVVLIDARSQAEYDAGHVPGALPLPWQDNVDAGRLRPRAELEARHADIPTDATVVAYCQTGSRASMSWLVLVHLGYPDVRLYDGSMAAWTQDASRPLE